MLLNFVFDTEVTKYCDFFLSVVLVIEITQYRQQYLWNTQTIYINCRCYIAILKVFRSVFTVWNSVHWKTFLNVLTWLSSYQSRHEGRSDRSRSHWPVHSSEHLWTVSFYGSSADHWGICRPIHSTDHQRWSRRLLAAIPQGQRPGDVSAITSTGISFCTYFKTICVSQL